MAQIRTALERQRLKNSFRPMARGFLERARQLLSDGNDEAVYEAALSLRKALEALTYERAFSYEDDLGPDVMETWQPAKLLDRMLEVDPHADQTASISFGVEPSRGETPKEMKFLGTDKVLPRKGLRSAYNALGNFLHIPTIRQIEQGKGHDAAKVRQKCDEVVALVEEVLSSTIYAASFGNYVTIDCECGASLRRRMSYKIDETVKVNCWDCSASYQVTGIPNSQEVNIELCSKPLRCPRDGCGTEHEVWERDVALGRSFVCQGCGYNLTFALGIAVTPPEKEGTSDLPLESGE